MADALLKGLVYATPPVLGAAILIVVGFGLMGAARTFPTGEATPRVEEEYREPPVAETPPRRVAVRTEGQTRGRQTGPG